MVRGYSGREDGRSMGLRERRRNDGARARGRRGSEGTRAEVAAGRMLRGWLPVCHPRTDQRRPSRRGWRHDRRHPLRVAWLPSASPNVRPTLCAESACGRALYHNVIELAVLPRVPIVVDFVGLVKKKKEGKKKGAGAGEDKVREIHRSVKRTLRFFWRESPHHRRFAVVSHRRYLLDQSFFYYNLESG